MSIHQWYGTKHLCEFCVDVEPIPQGSKTAFVTKKGKAVVVEGRNAEGRERFNTWRQDVQQAAHKAREEMGFELQEDQAIQVVIFFYFDRPKSVSVKKRPSHTVAPDVDKLVRAVFDALTGIIFKDDAQVVNVSAYKAYCEGDLSPGARIKLDVVVPIYDEKGDLRNIKPDAQEPAEAGPRKRVLVRRG